jgi:hypothetical protein
MERTGVREVRYNLHLETVAHDWEPAIARCTCGGWYSVQAATITSRVQHSRCYVGPESAVYYIGEDLRARLAEQRQNRVREAIAARRSGENGSGTVDVVVGFLLAALVVLVVILGGTVAP